MGPLAVDSLPLSVYCPSRCLLFIDFCGVLPVFDLLIEAAIAACLWGIFVLIVTEEIRTLRQFSPMKPAFLPRDDDSGIVDVYAGRQRLGEAQKVAPHAYRFRSGDGREVTATSMERAVELGTARP